MDLSLLLEVAAEGAADRVAVGSFGNGLTFAELFAAARRCAALLAAEPVERVALLDTNSSAVPILLFGAALAGKAYSPLNYRLAPDRLTAIIDRLQPAAVVGDPVLFPKEGVMAPLLSRADLLARVDAHHPLTSPAATDPERVAVLLFTSGTSGEPKAAVLRHRHLTTYIMSTVEFLGAGEDEAALVSVPPYHVAAVSAVLSSVWAGRRTVYLPSFDAPAWVAAVRQESITHAMVVPTMLGRILDVIAADKSGLPSLRHLSYGGGRMPGGVVSRAMELLPDVDLVNAYGLTETSSTISVLGPDDHRTAHRSADLTVRRRLTSVGRPVPAVEVEIRDAASRPVPTGQPGVIWVRGEQVSGEYLGTAGLEPGAWFDTRDGGWLDADGFLYVEGRLDDVIVRGGENLSPGEIEDVLLAHPAVAEVGVAGVPDEQWGERVVAAVVLRSGTEATEEDLQAWVRSRLRSSRVPSSIRFVPELPYTDTGKLLRRELRVHLAEPAAP